jgi:hypothetical protein
MSENNKVASQSIIWPGRGVVLEIQRNENGEYWWKGTQGTDEYFAVELYPPPMKCREYWATVDNVYEGAGATPEEAMAAADKAARAEARKIDPVTYSQFESLQTLIREAVRDWCELSLSEQRLVNTLRAHPAKSTLITNVAAEASLKALVAALEEQVTGAKWRRENEPESWNGADDEALERAESALKASICSAIREGSIPLEEDDD